MDKDGLPPYNAIDQFSMRRRRRRHRRRGLKFAVLALVAYLAYTRWTESRPHHGHGNGDSTNLLSIERLQADYAVCSKLRTVPQDPSGPRDRNARYIDGHNPTLIRNATVWVGEPAAGSSEADAHSGKAYSWIRSDVLLEYGMIQKVESDISINDLPNDTEIWDAEGRQLTTGIVDMHSHAGVDPLPSLRGGEDTNELSSDITPYVRSIDGLNPLDPQIQVIKSGGVTTSLVLPGSGNNMGGEAFVIKHAVGKPDGRTEIGNTDMLADPEQNWRYMKMACGENAKRVYGRAGERGPFSRLGEAWFFRHAFEQATTLVKSQDDWCNAADSLGVEHMGSYLPQDLQWESLGAALRGQVHINTHCYTVADLEAFVRHTNEFKFPVRAFHHAHQTYIVPEVLKRAWGNRPPAAALFADNMYYKVEAYTASEQAGKILYENGITPVYVSDNPVLNAQHVVFEAAKAYQYGLPYHAALAGVTSAPADLLGLGERIGKIKPGFDADVVVWDSDPLSVGATPLQVWIDGTAQLKDPVALDKPLTAPMNPDVSLAEVKTSISVKKDVIFTGISKVLMPEHDQKNINVQKSGTVVISSGRISCIGKCEAELESASVADIEVIDLHNGYLTPPFTAFGSYLGLEEISSEGPTQNGADDDTVFSRAVDGLLLQNKQLAASHAHGVTKAISAPKYRGGGHRGVSAGFLTGAHHSLEKHAVFADEVSVHYTLALSAKQGKTPSISSAVGALRRSLFKAVDSNETISDTHSEEAYLKRVVDGEIPLAITVHSADTIASTLRLKSEVDAAIAASITSSTTKPAKTRMIIVGGAESHLLAKQIAAADVSVVLAPLLPYSTSWEERRSLPGAPLTNGTAIDALLDAGVLTAIGTDEDWEVRDLNLMAGIAYRNGGGKLSETDALDLISKNVEKILGIEKKKKKKKSSVIDDEAAIEDFIVFEGNPLEIGSRVRSVGDGQGSVTVWT